ncbi:MAG: DUF393 domain-containing protein [Candidatus Poseidoniaceae archaeon]|jgi:predicted DCC family thiol-disulfide oxidoreductase YuxK|nr:DUF393 domain-containing protein [Candidatus Poseidoniaceae archaeon]
MKDTVYIDGLCALCTKTGKFISKRLVKDLEIIELGSEAGKEMLNTFSITKDSIVLIRNNQPFVYSSAAIRCLLYMRWNWYFIYPFVWLIPFPIRDLLYKIVAKLRHKIN